MITETDMSLYEMLWAEYAGGIWTSTHEEYHRIREERMNVNNPALAGDISIIDDRVFLDTNEAFIGNTDDLAYIPDKAAIMELLARNMVLPVGNCLEVGSGTSIPTIFLKEQGMIGEAYAVDALQPQIDKSLKIAAKRNVEVNFQKAYAQNLPFVDGYFQAVICIDALHWNFQWRQAIREMARVLAPDGQLFLSTLYGGFSRGLDDPMEVAPVLLSTGLDITSFDEVVGSMTHTERLVTTCRKATVTGLVVPQSLSIISR